MGYRPLDRDAALVVATVQVPSDYLGLDDGLCRFRPHQPRQVPWPHPLRTDVHEDGTQGDAVPILVLCCIGLVVLPVVQELADKAGAVVRLPAPGHVVTVIHLGDLHLRVEGVPSAKHLGVDLPNHPLTV